MFWPGDSDALPGFEQLEVSVFLANIGGSFASDRHAAADLAERLAPDLVVPIHYDTFEALEADDAAFVADLDARGIRAEIDG